MIPRPRRTPRGTVAARPLAPVPHGAPGLTAGWRAYGAGQAPTQQIGAFAGSLLNQYPVNLPGVQLLNGRAGNNPAWFTPTRFAIPLGSQTQTQRPVNLPGGQRYGSQFSGPIGPISAAAAQARVAAQQVRQSGLSVAQWAVPLMPALN